MEYELIWGGDPEDARVNTSGVATIEGLNAWVQEGLSDSRYRPGMRILVDHSQLDWGNMSLEDIYRRIELFARDAAYFGKACAAIVMRAPADYGIAKMEQAYIELRPELDIKIEVFFSIDDAREWMRTLPPADADPDDS